MPNLTKVFVIEQLANVYSDAEFSEFKQKYSKPFIDVSVDSDGRFDLREPLNFELSNQTGSINYQLL